MVCLTAWIAYTLRVKKSVGSGIKKELRSISLVTDKLLEGGAIQLLAFYKRQSQPVDLIEVGLGSLQKSILSRSLFKRGNNVNKE